MKKKISIIVPCYNEEESLILFYNEIQLIISKMKEYDFELIFINDGSKDDTLNIIKKLSSDDNSVKYVSFSRNFGKEAAMLAGFENSIGDYVTIMDADLQDPPHLLIEMIEYIENDGFDSIATRRISRENEPKIRSFFARMFYKIINVISKVDIVDGARDYRLMTREMVDAIISMKEYNRFSKGIFGWIGFETKWLEYKNVERIAGETKWSFWKLFIYSLEGIIAFSTMPLFIISFFGIIFCIIAFLIIIMIILKTIMWGEAVSGWPSMMCVIFFVSGIQLFCTGIIGAYLAKTYVETKQRPIYIIKEKN